LYKIRRWVMLIIFGLLVLIPTIMVLLTSFKTTQNFNLNPTGIPEEFQLTNYIDVITENNLFLHLLNSIIVTVGSVALCLFVSSLISYTIMRLEGWKSGVLYSFFILGMIIPPQVTMVPLFGIVDKLGLTNSLLGLIFVSTATFMSIAVFIIGGFMKTIPKDTIEASAIDGASEWNIFSKIVLPMSLPSLATASIFVIVMVWNDLLYPLLFINADDKKTLPLMLLDFQGQYLTDYPKIFSGVIISSLPIVIAYIFLQRFFIAGITAGSTKG